MKWSRCLIGIHRFQDCGLLCDMFGNPLYRLFLCRCGKVKLERGGK